MTGGGKASKRKRECEQGKKKQRAEQCNGVSVIDRTEKDEM